MSFLTTRAFRPALSAASTTRTLQFQAPIARTLTSHSSRHGNDPEVLEKNKQSLLRKHQKDSKEDPHWHEELASDAEAFIKAERNEIHATEDEIAKLAEQTVKGQNAKREGK